MDEEKFVTIIIIALFLLITGSLIIYFVYGTDIEFAMNPNMVAHCAVNIAWKENVTSIEQHGSEISSITRYKGYDVCIDRNKMVISRIPVEGYKSMDEWVAWAQRNGRI